MRDLICDTSPLQYLHQLGRLDIIPALAGDVFVPPSVVEELAAGRASGLNIPDPEALGWVTIRRAEAGLALPLVTDLGPGETEVLMLGLELPEAVVVLDDGLARRMAGILRLHLTGTLGLLLDAKRAGLVPAVRPLIDQLDQLRFRLAPQTRTIILRMADEEG